MFSKLIYLLVFLEDFLRLINDGKIDADYRISKLSMKQIYDNDIANF